MSDLWIIGRWLVRLWASRPGALAFIGAATLGSAGLTVAFPWLWQGLLDAVGASEVPSVGALVGWIAVVGASQAVVYAALQAARSWVNRDITRELRALMARRLAEAHPDALRPWASGDLAARMLDDADDKSSWFLCSGVLRGFEALVIAGAAFGSMLWTEPSLAGWLVLPLPLLLVAQALGQRRATHANQDVQRAISGTSEEIASTFGALRTVKAAGLEGVLRGRFDRAVEDQQRAEIRLAAVQNAVGQLFQFGWQATLAGLIAFGGAQVMSGELTLGRFVAFEGLTATLVWPMFDFGVLVSRAPQVAVALRRVEEVLAIRAAETPVAAAPASGALAATDVGVDTILAGVSLGVAAGERVAVVGRVGSGKSTLLEALAGLRARRAGR